jgi:hypothetical protein
MARARALARPCVLGVRAHARASLAGSLRPAAVYAVVGAVGAAAAERIR